jgi:hypothetical protein
MSRLVEMRVSISVNSLSSLRLRHGAFIHILDVYVSFTHVKIQISMPYCFCVVLCVVYVVHTASLSQRA